MKKKSMKKIFAMLLVMAMVVQVIPSTVFETNAADASTISYEDVVDSKTGIKYVWYEDISEYRMSKPYTYPIEDGYVFAGWFKASTEEGDAIGTNMTGGSAWAKFVPEETLTVKGQIDKDLSNYDTESGNGLSAVKLRLVTSVDSLKYKSVGFGVTINGTTKEFPISQVFTTVKLVESEHGTEIKDASSIFGKASAYFATITLSQIPNGSNNNFENMEINVVPYWETKDGTKVTGVSRNRMLISDERANDEDGSSVDFTKSERTYTYMDAQSDDNKASYKYFKGSSDVVYLKGTYTSDGVTGNKFGISIRNGGVTRQVFFNGHGVEVVDGVTNNITTTGFTDSIPATTFNQGRASAYHGIYVWLKTNATTKESAVSTMLAETTKKSHDIIWAIYENMLFCSVDGQISYRIPMYKLCSSWQDGRYYQLGVAGYNVSAASGIKFAIEKMVFGKSAIKKDRLLTFASEDVKDMETQQMIYEPITGSYVAPMSSSANDSLTCYAITGPVESDTAVALETEIEWNAGSGSYPGVTIALDGTRTVQFELQDTMTAKLFMGYEYSYKGVGNGKDIGNAIGSLVTNFSDVSDGKYKVTAAVYDGKFYVKFNDVTAYEAGLGDLFYSYSGSETVSLGITCHYSNRGLAQFHDVKTYLGQDAIDMKMEGWTYYPSYAKSLVTTTGFKPKCTIATGKIDMAPWEACNLGTSSDVWQITGTMTHDAKATGDILYAWQGFGMTDGTNNLRIMGAATGYTYDTQFGPSNDIATLTSNIRRERSESLLRTYDGYFNTAAQATVKFQAIIAHNTFYMWLGQNTEGAELKFAWQIPLKDLQTEFTEGDTFTVNIQDANRNATFENLKVRKGSEVDATLLKTLKSSTYMDWHNSRNVDANLDLKTLSSDGKVKTENKTGGYNFVVSNTADETVWLSGTWEKVDDKAYYYGIKIVQDDYPDRVRDIRFSESGISVMASNQYSAANIPIANNDVNCLTKVGEGSAPGLIWAVKKNETVTNSPIQSMVAANAGSTHEIAWAIKDATLYGKVDGVTCIILPLEKICTLWTKDANLKYRIGFSNWGNKSNGDVNISNVELLFGDEAESKLVAQPLATSDYVTNSMSYDAIEGAYMPYFRSGFAGLYSSTTAPTTGVQADIEWVDKAYADSGVGISVRIVDPENPEGFKSMQVYVQGLNGQIRTQKNQTWRDADVIQIGNDILNGAVPFNSDGKSHVKALVKNDVLYIYYNGVLGYALNLEDYIEGYVSGCNVQIGIATWDANQGLALFENVKFISDDAVDTMTPSVSLDEASTAWDVTGTMTQENLNALVSQGFTITAGEKTLTLLGKENGFTTSTDDVYSYNADEPSYVIAHSENYNNFFRTDGVRTKAKITFRLRLVEDVLRVWFDDVLLWEIPLTEIQFGGFDVGTAYQISLCAEGVGVSDVFDEWSVLQGEDVPWLFIAPPSERSTSIATVDYKRGSVTFPGSTSKEFMYFQPSSEMKWSDYWELKGTITRDSSESSVIGFIVQDSEEHQATYNFWTGNAVAVGKEWPWTYYSSTDYPENVFENVASEEFAKCERKSIQYRIVLTDDILYAYFDGQLTWKLPLTNEKFGYTASVNNDTQTLAAFTAGSQYRLGIKRIDAQPITISNIQVTTGSVAIPTSSLYIRDPFVLADNYDGTNTYYMYGTHYHNGSFEVYTSIDRKLWTKSETPCFTPSENFWGGTTDFYAPEVFKYTVPGTSDTAYYMFATFTGSVAEGSNTNVRGTAILKAESPLGPFTEWSEGAVTWDGHDCLDGTLYIENGIPYMIYTHEHTCDACNTGAGSMMYVQLTEDLKVVASGATHKTLFNANRYNSGYSPVAEGPFVYTTGTGKYLLWSTYNQGYTQVATPFKLNYNTMYTNVRWYSKEWLKGGGHGMVFKDFDGKDILVLHTPSSGEPLDGAGPQIPKFISMAEITLP